MIYLASPYTHTDWHTREQRYLNACKAVEHLLLKEDWVYSPIVHCHELAKMCNLPTNFIFWQKYNFAMLEKCDILTILRIDGWERSDGVREELKFAKQLGKEINYL